MNTASKISLVQAAIDAARDAIEGVLIMDTYVAHKCSEAIHGLDARAIVEAWEKR